MTEEEGEIFLLSKEELEKVEHTIVREVCCAEGCNRYTRIKDYGISPIFYSPKSTVNGIKTPWVDCSRTFFLCAGHWKIYENRPGMIKLKPGNSIDYIVYPIMSNQSTLL